MILRWRLNRRFFDYRFVIPLLFAECLGVGRANSPGKANLVLCAWMAHKGGLVGNAQVFRYPERSSRGKRDGMAFFWSLFLLLLKEK